MALGCCDKVHLAVHYCSGKKKHIFWRLNVLGRCCAANHYSKSLAFFLNFEKSLRGLRVN